MARRVLVWALAPLLLPGSPRAANAVPSASTSCRRTVRGSTIPGRPRTDPRIPAWISWPNVKASALRIALAAAEGLRPSTFVLSCKRTIHPIPANPSPARNHCRALLPACRLRFGNHIPSAPVAASTSKSIRCGRRFAGRTACRDPTPG